MHPVPRRSDSGNPAVLVLEHAKAVAWPPDPGRRPAPALALDLSDALTTEYGFDAHTTQYAPIAVGGSPRRLRNTVFAQAPCSAITMQTLWVDFDDAAAHASGEPAGTEWRQEFARRCQAMHRELGGFTFFSRGGAKSVWLLPSPEPLRDLRDAALWRARYLAVCSYVHDRFGLDADRACSDWGRLFRLPRSTRKGNADPDDYGIVCGNPRRVDVFEADVRPYVRAPDRPLPDRGAAHGHPTYVGGFDPRRAGLFATLLEARGDLGRELASGKWACRCPASRERGDHGLDTSAVVWAAGAEQTLGVLHCSHARCDDWRGDLDATLKWFTTAELLRAQIRVGTKDGQ